MPLKPSICVTPEMAKILAGVWHDRLRPGAVVLTYLASRNFNVIRFPTRPDRSADGQSVCYRDSVACLDKFSDKDLDRLASELKLLTAKTQLALRSIYPSGYVPLTRAIAPMDFEQGQYVQANRKFDKVEIFPMLAAAAKKAGLPSIAIDFDIVSGWSLASSTRYGTLQIRRDWPIDSILLVSDLLMQQDGKPGPLESDEWLCINQNPRGLIEILTPNFKVINLPKQYMEAVDRHLEVERLATELASQASLAPTERNVVGYPPRQRDIRTPRIPRRTLRSRFANFLYRSKCPRDG